MMNYPNSTYRLQLNQFYTLNDAINQVGYFNDLGVSDLYLSPIFKAAPGSMHGYDVVDYSVINPEIGTEEELAHLAKELRRIGMGLILDIVPNHMCIASEQNPWWRDVLTHGQESKYASYFDIDWHSGPSDLENKVLLPFLDRPLSEAIEEGLFRVIETDHGPMIEFGSSKYPLRPDSLNKKEDIGALLEMQHYRLDSWKRGIKEVNYRRFFHINELACIRVEEPEIFQDVHAKLFEWIEKGWITGLRVDHIDGLTDPLGYLELLDKNTGGIYTIVEKILMEDEVLRKNWPVQGTTGYEFTNLLNQLYIDHRNQDAFIQLYRVFAQQNSSPGKIILDSKEQVLNETMQPEEKRILKEVDPKLHAAVHALLVVFPYYRTYIRSKKIDLEDEEMLEKAFAAAKKRDPKVEEEIWDAVRELFRAPSEFLMRFQQTTGPIMAKGYEDTALYRYFPLSSINEVGGEIQVFGISPEEFHKMMQRREHYTLSATTTHDTKRSEDVRAAINVLSEIPDLWEERIFRWREMNKTFNPPEPNDEYLLYQTIVGLWKEKEDREWIRRIEEYMIKAAREEKRQTDWISVNEEYENRLGIFVQQVLNSSIFLEDLDEFMGHLNNAIEQNILSQTVMKLTAPGVPDLYQGCEKPCFTLVDPDNRRSVVHELERPSFKQQITQKILNIRRKYPELFKIGKYIPLETDGEDVIAFLRQNQQHTLLVCAGRFFLKNPDKKAVVYLPQSGEWTDLMSGETNALKKSVPINQLMQNKPFGIWLKQ